MRISNINFRGMTKPVRKILEYRMYEKRSKYNPCSYYKHINDPKLNHFDTFSPVRTQEDYMNDLNTIEKSKRIDIIFDNEKGFLVRENFRFKGCEDYTIKLSEDDLKIEDDNYYTIPRIAEIIREMEN